MKTIICSGAREGAIDQEVICGALRYRIDAQWAKWPEELKGIQVMNSCWGGDILYVATADKQHPIVLFDREGGYLKSVGAGLFKKAHSMFVTPKDTLLVADANKSAHVILELTLDGELIHTFGTPGKPGDTGYDFDYFATLQREGKSPTESPWNKNPESVARIDSICRRGEPFCRPCSMTMAPDGEYYAADGYGNCAVHRFDPQRRYTASWGEPGTEPGAFRVVHDVLLDSRDRVWVADRENARVQLFTRTGELLAATSGNLMRIGGIWLDDQYLYIGELDGGLTVVDLETLEVAGQAGYLKSPLRTHGITGDSEGNLYLSTNNWYSDNLIRLVRQ